jgi:transketolase
MGGHARKPDLILFGRALCPFFSRAGNIATRKASGQVLAAIKPHLPGLIGGSADLAPSNNTYLKGFEEFKERAAPTSVSASENMPWGPF